MLMRAAAAAVNSFSSFRSVSAAVVATVAIGTILFPIVPSLSLSTTSGSSSNTSNHIMIPERLLLKPQLLQQAFPDVHEIPLQSIIDCSVKPVVVSSETQSLRSVAQSHSGTVGALAFVVRRPGCSLCREHGVQLAELAAKSFDNQKFGMFGIVKETGVDDVGLKDFYEQYFTFDLYVDEQLNVYSALGSRNILHFRTWNPFRLYRGFVAIFKRLSEKKIEGNLAGEGLILGGVLFFDKSGTLRFADEENAGEELNVDDILAALRGLEAEEEEALNSVIASAPTTSIIDKEESVRSAPTPSSDPNEL